MASMTKFPAYNLAHRVPCPQCGTLLVMPNGALPIRISDLDRADCRRCRRRVLALVALTFALALIAIGINAWQ